MEFIVSYLHVVVLHGVLAILALRRVWRARGAEIPVLSFFWAALALAVPLLGPIMTLGFAMPPRHQGSIPPARHVGGNLFWHGGWR